eukprot:TRINITY_DN94355_c0_g1_i1.p2 TRINITY_DN94355_c0_g1~~TRINITY_DN94355_c0_g1_i1.p2  ORF type:complete len:120 (+),score=21.79 TRINITY_DN94355_c0_g1_i1:50-361(+)
MATLAAERGVAVARAPGPLTALVSAAALVAIVAGEAVLEFPSSPSPGGLPSTIFSFPGVAVTMLLLGLSYCVLRACLTGVKQITCLEETPAPSAPKKRVIKYD